MARRTVGACRPVHFSGRAHTDHKEAAQNFKEQDNEYFEGKRYWEALEFYTQGVEAKPDDGRLREVLLLNRSACNLELRGSVALPSPSPLSLYILKLSYLENYGSILRGCATVIAANPVHHQRLITARASRYSHSNGQTRCSMCVRALVR
jgi:hypothetical protein